MIFPLKPSATLRETLLELPKRLLRESLRVSANDPYDWDYRLRLLQTQHFPMRGSAWRDITQAVSFPPSPDSSMVKAPPASRLSRLLFHWVTAIARTAGHRQLQQTDLAEPPESLLAHRWALRFEEALAASRSRGRLALMRAILSIGKVQFLKIFGLSLLALVASFGSPLLLREILKGIDPASPHPAWLTGLLLRILGSAPRSAYPLLCSIGLGLNSILGIFAIHWMFYLQPVYGKRVMNMLSHAIFSQATTQLRSNRSICTSGHILNLVATDCQRIFNFLIFSHSIWYHPMTLGIALFFLFRLVGTPALWGSVTLGVIFLASVTLSKRQTRLRKELSSLADTRVSITRESLLHIKAAKLQGWEDNLITRIQSIRAKEAELSKALARLSATSIFIATCAPALAMGTTTVCMMQRGMSLNASTIFPMLALFTLLRFAMIQLPETFYNFIEARVSLDRITAFLATQQFQECGYTPTLPQAISIKNLICEWPDGSRALDIPSFEVKRGELIAIVGSVGSGKSAFLLSLLGEISPMHGSIQMGGAVEYVAQLPWILSDSIRNNILGDQPYDAERYRRAVQASCLASDIATLPHGDLTEIGERGINLSGGQRQRVALARTLYRGAEIYLFDDPLSALDPQVANRVFSQLIQAELADKTRILVSHRIEYARAADRIVVFENGRIVEDGDPASLEKQGGRFAELLNVHASMSRHGAEGHTEESAITPEAEVHLAELEEESEAPQQLIAPEERATGAVSRSVARTYLVRLAPGGALVILLLLFLSRHLASLANDLWLAWSANNSHLEPRRFISGYIITIVLLCLAAYFRSIYILSRGLSAGLSSHEKLLRGVLHAPMRFFESNPVGRIMNRFSRDLENVDLQLPRAILDAGACLCDTAVTCCVIGFVAPPTFIIILPVALLYFAAFRRYRPISRDLQRLYSTTLSPIFSTLSETLTGIETIRASGSSRRFMSKFEAALDLNSRVLHMQICTNRWIGMRLELLGTMMIVAAGVAISLGYNAVVGVAFSGLALSYASSMTSTMNWAIRSLSMVENNLTSFERIQRYADTPPERLEGMPKPPLWPARGEIEILDLSARYRPELPPALARISCSIQAGSRVGIVGRTGSGKSTLILALLRLVEPCEGCIIIDGVDLSKIQLADLRSSLAVVPQEPVLFSGILRESVDPFNEYSDKEIVSAFARVELSGFLSALPDGLKTEVHEGGFNFSAGQRQLICLARALLRRSRVIILDEATASIDVQTDFAIQRAIREVFTGSTVLVIAHRLGTILDSDLILTLEDGSLVETGAPEKLLSSPHSKLSRFAQEMRSQSVNQ